MFKKNKKNLSDLLKPNKKPSLRKKAFKVGVVSAAIAVIAGAFVKDKENHQ